MSIKLEWPTIGSRPWFGNFTLGVMVDSHPRFFNFIVGLIFFNVVISWESAHDPARNAAADE